MIHTIWLLDTDDTVPWVSDRLPIGEIDLPSHPSDAEVLWRLEEEGIIDLNETIDIDTTLDFEITLDGRPILTLELEEPE